MKDSICFATTMSGPLALSLIKYNLRMQEANSWEVVVSSLISEVKNIEQTLKNQNLSVEEYLQQNNKQPEFQILHAQLRSTQTSFKKMEDKLQDMIIYLCRAMTTRRLNDLTNLLGDHNHGL